VWLREKNLPPPDRRRLAAALADLLHGIGGVLISSPGPGREMADGIHLGASDQAEGARVFGRSCHGAADLAEAAGEGCQWATLSPIFASISKPGYGPALGPGALSACPLPVWALGGVDAGNAADCLRAGASGVAVMGSVLGSADPAGEVARLLGALP
jgi:thiamine monophosphate synthase